MKVSSTVLAKIFKKQSMLAFEDLYSFSFMEGFILS